MDKVGGGLNIPGRGDFPIGVEEADVVPGSKAVPAPPCPTQLHGNGGQKRERKFLQVPWAQQKLSHVLVF